MKKLQLLALVLLGSLLPSAGRAAPPADAASSTAPAASTPRRAMRQFVDACTAGDYESAAKDLDLRPIDPEWRAKEGPKLARRLVVPIGRFLDEPFQHWSRVSEDIMGTVELPADFTVPVDVVRAELERLCKDDRSGTRRSVASR